MKNGTFSQPQLVVCCQISGCHHGPCDVLKSVDFQVLPFLRALSTPELAALEVRGKKWMDGCFFSLKVKVLSCCFFFTFMKIFSESFW